MAAGPVHKTNKFQLYLFPESFRLKELAVMYAAGIMYAIIVRIIKHFIIRHKQRLIAPVWYAAVDGDVADAAALAFFLSTVWICEITKFGIEITKFGIEITNFGIEITNFGIEITNFGIVTMWLATSPNVDSYCGRWPVSELNIVW